MGSKQSTKGDSSINQAFLNNKKGCSINTTNNNNSINGLTGSIYDIKNEKGERLIEKELNKTVGQDKDGFGLNTNDIMAFIEKNQLLIGGGLMTLIVYKKMIVPNAPPL